MEQTKTEEQLGEGVVPLVLPVPKRYILTRQQTFSERRCSLQKAAGEHRCPRPRCSPLSRNVSDTLRALRSAFCPDGPHDNAQLHAFNVKVFTPMDIATYVAELPYICSLWPSWLILTETARSSEPSRTFFATSVTRTSSGGKPRNCRVLCDPLFVGVFHERVVRVLLSSNMYFSSP